MQCKFATILRQLLFAGLVLGLTGCGQMVTKHRQQVLEDAESAEKNGHFVDALNFYESALDGTPASADQHFQMAIICESKINDPIGALFHFRRCERLNPSGPHAQEARTSRQRLEPAVLAILSGGSTLVKQDAVVLKNKNLELTNQIIKLKEQLKIQAQAARERRSETGAGTKPLKNTPPDPELIKKMGGRTYVVEPGDTLAGIARKIYGSKARDKDIQDANVNNLPDPKKLQIGQVLILPE